MRKNNLFKMPKSVTITGRISSLTNAFVNGIIPVIEPSDEEVQNALKDLGMEDGIRCAYCGGEYREWDHFYPLVKNRKPSGYISEINNLVPCCSSCNSKKGNKLWADYMKTFQTQDHDWAKRYQLLNSYASNKKRTFISEQEFQEICGENWLKHWNNLDALVLQMNNYQVLSDTIRIKLRDKYVLAQKESGREYSNISSAEPIDEIKIGKYVKKYLWPILMSLPESDVNSLLTKEYSKKEFGMSTYPILSRDCSRRYYASPIQINEKTYYVCSQWRKEHFKKLRTWIDKHQ